jgi:hypothetical protein
MNAFLIANSLVQLICFVVFGYYIVRHDKSLTRYDNRFDIQERNNDTFDDINERQDLALDDKQDQIDNLLERIDKLEEAQSETDAQVTELSQRHNGIVSILE